MGNFGSGWGVTHEATHKPRVGANQRITFWDRFRPLGSLLCEIGVLGIPGSQRAEQRFGTVCAPRKLIVRSSVGLSPVVVDAANTPWLPLGFAMRGKRAAGSPVPDLIRRAAASGAPTPSAGTAGFYANGRGRDRIFFAVIEPRRSAGRSPSLGHVQGPQDASGGARPCFGAMKHTL